MKVLFARSCPTLYDPVHCSPPGSSVHGLLQARILEWVAISSFRGSSPPGIEPTSLLSPALAGGFLTTSTTSEALGIKLQNMHVSNILNNIIWHSKQEKDIFYVKIHEKYESITCPLVQHPEESVKD